MCKQVMYAEIPYEMNGIVCLTLCPCQLVFGGTTIRVGSLACVGNCPNYVGVNKQEQIVKCNHPKILE